VLLLLLQADNRKVQSRKIRIFTVEYTV
jgi:hypothetical protein